MRIYQGRWLAFLLFALLATGCSSGRAAFQFSPDKSRGAQPLAAPQATAKAVGTAPAEAYAAAVVPMAPRALPRRRAAAFLAPRLRAAGAAPAFRMRKATWPSGFLATRAAERTFLIGGIATGLLGLGANYSAMSAPSSHMLLLSTGHYLLVLSALLLLVWFVLVVRRGTQE